MTKKKVLVIQPLHPDGMAVLEARDDIEIKVITEYDEETLVREVADVHGMTVRVAKITRRVIEAAPNLEVVARHGVGYDAVDQAALNERGIPLTVTPRANAVSVAEHAFAFMLALGNRFVALDREMRTGNWMARSDHVAIDLEDKNLLIIGFGRIGTRVAKRARAFDMKVHVYDPYVQANVIEAAGCVNVTDLSEALPDMDVVTLHCPKSEETTNIISAAELSAMKSSAMLINCARGGLINEEDLYRALSDGEIAEAGLDVFAVEPATADNPLFELDNVMVSPHTAGNSIEALRRMGMDSAQCVLDAFDGKLTQDVVINTQVLKA
ncbi:MAG: hydroxyacid dehydrogenase [Rhodospirillaceae bacterium]|nr:hydroxyacid dehydrogenase [Rhodospirillaceae bacterium]MBT6137986.1 hydroxyacid dehydrogenase [Rhodospirillaceae bacterium]